MFILLLLIQGSTWNHKNLIKLLVDNGAIVNEKANDGNTALMCGNRFVLYNRIKSKIDLIYFDLNQLPGQDLKKLSSY